MGEWLSSVRARTTIIATLVFAAALAVATFALLTSLESSLIDEVDRGLDARAAFIDSQLELPESGSAVTETIRETAGFDTLELLLDSDGSTLVSSDPSGDGNEILDQLPVLEEPFDADLSSFVETEGSDNMRVLVVEAEPEFPDDSELIVVATSLKEADDTVANVTLVAVIAGPLLVGLVGALVWLLVGRALAPVGRIQSEVEEITATDLDRRVEEPAARDEIGRLARTMNRMLERLDSAQQTQQRFVADASHELRSPLAGMAAQLDVNLAHPETADWQETATALREQTTRLQTLVDDLLLLARGDAADVIVDAGQLVDLDDLVLEQAASLGASRPGVIETAGVSAGLTRGDEEALRRLIGNLIANGLRHARERVALGVGEEGGDVQLIVDDDGDGIPVPDRERIFERFTRLDDARARDHGGSGLGLAICREIATAHGGTIEVGDSPLGGARFEVRLPSADSA